MAVDAGDKPVNGKKKVGTPKRKGGGGETGATPKAVKGVKEEEASGEESLARWAEEDAAALSLLVSLIPPQHYAATELLANNVPSKYVKKAGGTESEKVARASGARKARKRAKFDADAAGKKGEDSYSDEEGGQARSEGEEEEEDVGTDKVKHLNPNPKPGGTLNLKP
jgi:hypothetical protein